MSICSKRLRSKPTITSSQTEITGTTRRLEIATISLSAWESVLTSVEFSQQGLEPLGMLEEKGNLRRQETHDESTLSAGIARIIACMDGHEGQKTIVFGQSDSQTSDPTKSVG